MLPILKYIFKFIGKNNSYSFLKYLLAFLFLSIYAFVNNINFFVLTSILLKTKINWIQIYFKKNDTDLLKIICYTLLINSIIYELAYYYFQQKYIIFKEELRNKLASKYFEKILQLELTTYFKKNPNDYVRVCYNSSQDIVYLIHLFKESIVTVLTIALSFIAIFIANKYVALLLCFSLILILLFKYRRKKRKELIDLGFNYDNNIKKYVNFIDDIFNIYKEIRIFRRQLDVLKISKHHMKNIGEAKFILDKHLLLSNSYLQSIFLICLIIIILLFANFHVDIIEFAPIFLLVFISIQKIIPGVHVLYLLLSHLSVSNYLIREGNELFLDFKRVNPETISVASFDEISIKDAKFSYDQTLVIANLTCKIHSNSITTIIGESGKGKTTFVEILAGLKSFNSGKLNIDGQSLNSFSQISSIISFVPQKVHLINDSIKNNVTLFDDSFSDLEIWNALEIVNLKFLFDKSPLKLNTILQKGGTNLSVGQAHRVGIARALLFKSKLLILDEFSAALDDENKFQIFDILQRIKKSMAIVITSHDSDIIELVDHKIIL